MRSTSPDHSEIQSATMALPLRKLLPSLTLVIAVLFLTKPAAADWYDDARDIIQELVEREVAKTVIPEAACAVSDVRDNLPHTINAIKKRRFGALKPTLRSEVADYLAYEYWQGMASPAVGVEASVATTGKKDCDWSVDSKATQQMSSCSTAQAKPVEAARVAFKEAVVELLNTLDERGSGGVDRSALQTVYIPTPVLHYGWSRSYANEDQRGGARSYASLEFLTLRRRFLYRESVYLALRLSVVDALGPFSEFGSRKQRLVGKNPGGVLQPTSRRSLRHTQAFSAPSAFRRRWLQNVSSFRLRLA